MSIYRFPPKSPVQEVVFRHANDRAPVALLRASSGASSDQLSTIRRAMDAGGWTSVPVTLDNKEYLQVNGFEKEQQLLRYMQQYHFSEGQPEFQAQEGDHAKRSTSEWLQDTSLKLSGWSYIVGDVSLLVSGLMSGRSKEVASGLFYTAGGAILARYGNVKTEHHLKEVSESTAEFVKKQAAALPEDCGLFTILKEKKEGVLPSVDRFLTRYPSQATISIYSLGSLAMLQSGMKHGKFLDVAYGGVATAANAAAILLPEKKDSEPKDKVVSGNAVHQWWDWMQEKPLRMVGAAYMVGAGLLGMSAYREYKENPKQRSYIFKFITAASYLIGDAMIAISSKDHTNADGKFDADEQMRIEALVAETISRQPKALQEPLLHSVAGFLANQDEMKGTALDISKSIQKQLEHMNRNPWASRADSTVIASPVNNR